MSKTLAIKFMENLKKISPTGIDKWVINTSFKDVNIDHPDDFENSWTCKCTSYPVPHFKCLCTNCITNVFHLRNTDTDDVVQVGCNCVRRVSKEGITFKKQCLNCEGLFSKLDKKNKSCCETCSKLYICTFGKYKGLCFNEIKQKDPGYCKWILGIDSKNSNITMFKIWLEKL